MAPNRPQTGPMDPKLLINKLHHQPTPQKNLPMDPQHPKASGPWLDPQWTTITPIKVLKELLTNPIEFKIIQKCLYLSKVSHSLSKNSNARRWRLEKRW